MLTIESTLIGIFVLIIITIIYVKFWNMIAEWIGKHLGIGKFIVGLFTRSKSEK